MQKQQCQALKLMTTNSIFQDVENQLRKAMQVVWEVLFMDKENSRAVNSRIQTGKRHQLDEWEI